MTQTARHSALIGTIRIQRACFARRDNSASPEEAAELDVHMAETKRQHRDIFDAIKAGDVQRSDACAVAHFELTKNRIIRVLFTGSSAFSDSMDLSMLSGNFD